ncbi:hypothetical protein [Streptomyces violascens]|uniref:hypothetical protein n=1 Tax=Streptomyces violascens TaxID=67381 RepID=UPI0016789B61|nr:hypothetical protein [Streptomyces violascens]
MTVTVPATMLLAVAPALAVVPAVVLVVIPPLTVVVPTLVPALTPAIVPAVLHHGAPTETTVMGETDTDTESGQPHNRRGHDRYPLKPAHHSTLPYVDTKP